MKAANGGQGYAEVSSFTLLGYIELELNRNIDATVQHYTRDDSPPAFHHRIWLGL